VRGAEAALAGACWAEAASGSKAAQAASKTLRSVKEEDEVLDMKLLQTKKRREDPPVKRTPRP
jgi:hypothetical protein